jgi:hypothetical protein
LITADCGGGNGNRTRLWKLKLQVLYFHEFGTGFTANFGRSKPINSDQ